MYIHTKPKTVVCLVSRKRGIHEAAAQQSRVESLRPQVTVNVNLAEDDHGSSHTDGGLLYAHVRGGPLAVSLALPCSSRRKEFNYDQVLERGGVGGLGLELICCKSRRHDTIHILVLRVGGSY
jgi:hypothetical protein